MEDEAIVADSAGHTMIDIEAFRTAKQAGAPREDDPEEDAPEWQLLLSARRPYPSRADPSA